MNEPRYKVICVVSGIILLLLQSLLFINIVKYPDAEPLVKTVAILLVVALIILFIFLSLKKLKIGPILGILIGAYDVYVFMFNLMMCLACVLFIIVCIYMIIELTKLKK